MNKMRMRLTSQMFWRVARMIFDYTDSNLLFSISYILCECSAVCVRVNGTCQ